MKKEVKYFIPIVGYFCLIFLDEDITRQIFIKAAIIQVITFYILFFVL